MSDSSEDKIEFYRKQMSARLAKLTDYKKGYDIDAFLADLDNYFDQQVDFDMVKVREFVEQPGKMEYLIQKAREKNTHPVSEFVKEILKHSVKE